VHLQIGEKNSFFNAILLCFRFSFLSIKSKSLLKIQIILFIAMILVAAMEKTYIIYRNNGFGCTSGKFLYL